MIDVDVIIEKAKDNLPYTSDIQASNYIVPVWKDDFGIDETFFHSNVIPDIQRKSYYEVMFRKQIIGGVAVGWEFVNVSQ